MAMAQTASPPNPPRTASSKSADLFAGDGVCRLSIEIEAKDMASLRQNPRDYVRAIISADGHVFANVGIRLKGRTGSFRKIDDKPAMTLQFNRFDSNQRFYGLGKIHLNNSVEDPSYANELIGGELFRASGVPAPRVTHALVQLNGRMRGLYVLKEGFTEDFLTLGFGRSDGRLYESEWGGDVDQPMKRNLGSGLNSNTSDLKELASAATDPDLSRRWRRLEKALDVDRFIDFVALEVMICHKDGYSLARNNFRIYRHPGTDKMVFLPSGMDQLFGIPDLPWKPHWAGIVARAVMDTPEGRLRYEARFPVLMTKLFNLEALSSRVDRIVQKLRPVLGRSEFAAIEQEGTLLKQRMIQRLLNLKSQLSQPDMTPLPFKDDVACLAGWVKRDDPADGRMEQNCSPDNISALAIFSGSNTTASWRTKALVPRGRYRFEAQGRVAAVKPLPFGRLQGAGLRLAGKDRQSARLIGSSQWQPLILEFEVSAELEEIEFVCELRARAGKAWFDVNSLRLVRTP
jgi:hypothetical protein